MHRQVHRAIELIGAFNPGTYVVGGAVRDRLLGATLADIDLSVPGDAIAAAERVASELPSRLIVLDRERGHVRLAVHSGPSDLFIDITSHAAGLERDLRGRDFTLNALAVPIDAWQSGADVRGSVIDPTGGIGDLDAKIVRMTSAVALAEDVVRLVRAARFASQLGFDIEPATMAAGRALADRVMETSPERVREEFYAIFRNPGAFRGVRLLDELGVLGATMPEVVDGKGVTQPPNHHYYDVFQHSVRTVAKVDPLLESAIAQVPDPRLAEVVPPTTPSLQQHLESVVGDGQSHWTLLRLAALLHDVGKPRCKSVDVQGRVRFLGHDEVGAEMVEQMLGRLRCSRRVIAHVSTMVRHHLRPSQVSAAGAPPTPRALYRYSRDLGDVASDIVYLNLADYLAARGPMLLAAEWRDYSGHCGVILNGGLEAPERSRPFLLLDGTEVMAEFGLEPGPQVGQLLRTLRSAEAEGTVQTRQEALEFLRRLV